MEIRRLTPDDIGTVLRLVALAGWNQTDRDVGRLLALEPRGCFAACVDGHVVGTTTTTTYGTDLAWVGMVLVDPEFRRKGIATALMETALEYLRGRGVRTIKLDATPVGRPVYERLGFEAETGLERWAGTGSAPERHLEGFSLSSWDQISAIDRAAFGADRAALMQSIITDSGPPITVGGRQRGVGGYAFARPGGRAAYVGPVVADDAGVAGYLLKIVAAGPGPVFIDIDPAFPAATELMRDLGFVRQRELLRMRLGPPIPLGPPPRAFAIAGPEVG